MMQRLVKLQKDSQGFTLVELMIVVAIIGILAAIAIPQFAAYRIRGYNASALSDTRNLNTSQAALFADWQRYGVTFDTAAAAFSPALFATTAAGVLLTGGDVDGDGIATLDTNGAPRGLQVAVGNGVTTAANTDVAVLAGTPTAAFSAVGKHQQGNTVYGVDSDTVNVYQNPGLIIAGTAMAAYPAIVTAAGTDDFQTVAAIGLGWSIK